MKTNKTKNPIAKILFISFLIMLFAFVVLFCLGNFKYWYNVDLAHELTVKKMIAPYIPFQNNIKWKTVSLCVPKGFFLCFKNDSIVVMVSYPIPTERLCNDAGFFPGGAPLMYRTNGIVVFRTKIENVDSVYKYIDLRARMGASVYGVPDTLFIDNNRFIGRSARITRENEKTQNVNDSMGTYYIFEKQVLIEFWGSRKDFIKKSLCLIFK